MPKRKAPEEMTLEELDAELAAADEAATAALGYKREVGLLLQRRRTERAAEEKLAAMTPAEAEALAAALGRRVDARAEVGLLTVARPAAKGAE